MNTVQSEFEFRAETLRGSDGFVRVGRNRSGQWWLCEPRGRPFFSCGVTSIGRTRLPAGATKSNAATSRPTAPNPSASERLCHWGFNSVGPWGVPTMFDPAFCRTEILEFRKALPEAAIRLGGALLPDVFDPRWVAACGAVASKRCLPMAGNTSLIGYFTDHELAWAQPDGESPRLQVRPDPAGKKPARRPSLLQICMSLEPSHAAYHAAWEFAFSANGGDLGSLGRAWELNFNNKESLRQLTRADTPLVSPKYLGDCELFTREFARRYFSTCASAIRRFDPGHLILGCRFAGLPGAAVLAECVSPHVDVISVNESRDNPGPLLDVFSAKGTRPLLVSGFSWVSEYFTMRPSPGEPPGYTRIERMLAKGRTSLEQIVTHPAVVGYAWHPWLDPLGSQPPFGQGLVHVDGAEAVEHTESLLSINSRAESLRRSAAPS